MNFWKTLSVIKFYSNSELKFFHEFKQSRAKTLPIKNFFNNQSPKFVQN